MMGDLQVCSPRHHCVLFGDGDSDSDDWLSTLSFPKLIHDPSLITPSSKWVTSENTISDILRRIQPTCVAHHKRKHVINFVQGLITTHLGCQVFPYGSVPFKTFLPDGDIDLTALCSSNIENALVSDVHALLTAQQTNGVTPYQVKDVHCIDAEVKLVKCIVEDIVVDISFNQLGGLCTLCFLEQVDRLVGKDHLFKRSIILIKAWCYYESRILGAHHGLISTYALEILVLYIFHLFHTSLHGPFAVLHRFLEYFSKFDWESYCISLHGPVRKSSLPDIVAEVPEIGGRELLLSKDFLRNCRDMFSVSSKGTEPSLRVFTLKHLNIIDPLKENNNLGRSVNRGNFYRICSAFKYGARKLGWILVLPEERIEGELNKFFANTLDRHCWTNEPFPSLDAHFGVSIHSSAPLETCYKDRVCLESIIDIRDEKISRTQVSFSSISSTGCHLTETVQKLETAVILNKNTSSTINTPDFSSIHTNQIDVVSENSYSAPQNGFLGLLGSQKIDNWNASCEMTTRGVHNVEIGLTSEVEPKDKLVASNLNCLYSDNKISSESSRSSFHVSENVSSGIDGKCNEGTERFDDVAKLLDLCGDYDSYIRNLKYGRICDKYVMSPTLPLSPPMLLHVQKNYPWQAIHRSLVRNHKIPSGIDRKGFSMEPQSDPVNRFDIVSEEKKKPQGIGTYFPRTNTRSYRDRQFQAKGRTQGQVSPTQSQRHDCGNELSETPQLLSIYAEDGHEFSEAEFPVLGNGKLKTSDSPPSSYFSKWRFPRGNGISWPFEELGSWPIHPEPCGAVSPETSNPSKQDTLQLSGSSSRIGLSATDIPSQVAENSEERVKEKSFHLKNNEEFPPLSR